MIAVQFSVCYNIIVLLVYETQGVEQMQLKDKPYVCLFVLDMYMAFRWLINTVQISFLNNNAQIRLLTSYDWVWAKASQNPYQVLSVSHILCIPLQWRHIERLKSPAYPLFAQPFIWAQIKENIKPPRQWPLCGESTGDLRIPHTKGQLHGKCFYLMTSSCVSDMFMCQINVFTTWNYWQFSVNGIVVNFSHEW